MQNVWIFNSIKSAISNYILTRWNKGIKEKKLYFLKKNEIIIALKTKSVTACIWQIAFEIGEIMNQDCYYSLWNPNEEKKRNWKSRIILSNKIVKSFLIDLRFSVTTLFLSDNYCVSLHRRNKRQLLNPNQHLMYQNAYKVNGSFFLNT